MSTTLAELLPAITIRQSHLRMIEEGCPAMAYTLIVDGMEGPSTAGADRGQAIHQVFAGYTWHLHETGRQTDWDECERIAHFALQDHPRLTYSQRQDVLDQAANIGQGFVFEPAHYYGSEEALETYIGEYRITGRLDLLEADVEEGWARVTDAKSNHRIPPDAEVRSDFQLMLYALLVVDNLPSVDTVEGRLWFTRYNRFVPQKEPASWTREDLEDFREHLAGKLAAFFTADRHDHIPGAHCQYCPLRRPGACTHWRGWYGNTPPAPLKATQARKLACQVIALEQAREQRLEQLKAYVNEHGALRVGSGAKAEAFDFWPSESEDYDAGYVLGLLGSAEILSLIGEQPLGELVSVNKRSKAWRSLMKVPEFRAAVQDARTTKLSTTFKHKGAGDE